MKRRKLLLVNLLVALVLSFSLITLSGCVTPDIVPREVILELVDPMTGETVQDYDTIELPKTFTLVQVRIKDKETGVYLTDNDLPENTIKGSIGVSFTGYPRLGGSSPLLTNGYWPKNSELIPNIDYYKVAIRFDCRPKNPEDPIKFQRKYEMQTKYVRIYMVKEPEYIQ